MTYASLRAGRGPNALVVEALGVLGGMRGRALDIGAGPLNDTRFLLELGFSVEAVDTDPCTLALAAAWRHPRLRVVHADVRDVPVAGGVLCCTFFGPEDAWAGRPGRTFLRAPEAGALFPGLEPVVLREDRYDGTDARDQPKHWHVVRCVFRRPAGSA
ncbi:class I SAM-dependent methyltransferase [Nonomuraea sp. NPDC005692]|uniref:class I SAM-dependent methyltransferase n=1 Tax=Nonomuraea sp. NPDC005692 TaxID=3157168 RepID=UPI0033E86D34